MPAAARFQGRVQTDARDASERSSHPSRRSIRQRASIPCKQVHFGALREEYGRAGLTLRKGVPANALFGAGLLYLALNVLAVTIGLSQNTTSVRRLAQECALLRAELEELRGRLPAEPRAAPPEERAGR